MYTSEQCLEKLKSASTFEAIAWKLEYDAALVREAQSADAQDQYADLLRNLHSNGFARSNQPAGPKKIKAFDELIDEEVKGLAPTDEFVQEVKTGKRPNTAEKPEECTSCEIVKKRRGRKAKGNQ